MLRKDGGAETKSYFFVHDGGLVKSVVKRIVRTR